MSPKNGSYVEEIAQLARDSAAPEFVEDGQLFAVPDGQGSVKIIDTEAYGPHPRRVKSKRQVLDAESFTAYVHKHGIENATEIWADSTNSRVVARINSHEGSGQSAGWDDHILELVLEHSKGWKSWMEFDQKWWDSQEDFAEFIETRALDVQDPDAGTLQEIILNFHASKGSTFQSTRRLTDGQVEFEYKEDVQASAGKQKLTVPTSIRLALQPYVGGPRVYINARFRFRVNGGALRLGYVLERPQEVLDAGFDDILTLIRDGRVASEGKTAFAGIAEKHIILNGRP